jgi:hypothetical protein
VGPAGRRFLVKSLVKLLIKYPGGNVGGSLPFNYPYAGRTAPEQL